MNNKKLSVFSSELLLLLAAIVWGFAFVAQKVGMDSIGPMAYNGIRFLLGSASLLPVIWFFNKKAKTPKPPNKVNIWVAGLITGLVLFVAATIQQIGIVYTTAGNAGFITTMYVILVPVFGLFFKQKVNLQTWIAAIIALIGLYFLSVSEGLTIVIGDAIVFVSAFFWAAQVLLASYYAPKVNIIKLAAIQFAITGFLSLIISFFTETYDFQNIYNAIIPILYGGVLSVGLAFTLQLIGQKNVIPSHAAIILSLESLFAAIGGWLILSEQLTSTEMLGAALMLIGVILSQMKFKKSV
jgi:drug/metabolite transporter (DMT)-like permease